MTMLAGVWHTCMCLYVCVWLGVGGPSLPLFLKRPLLLSLCVPCHPHAMHTAQLGFSLMRGISMSLGLNPDYFKARLFSPEPLPLFRIFNYPTIKGPSPDLHQAPGSVPSGGTTEVWGVGEHTDYGVLTILKQDDSGGLQVRPAGLSAAGRIVQPLSLSLSLSFPSPHAPLLSYSLLSPIHAPLPCSFRSRTGITNGSRLRPCPEAL
jgi:hypothetical protein